MTTLAVYGSSFNPPHRGHMDVIQQLLDPFDQVLVVPSAAHPFAKQLASFEDRIYMTQLAIDEMGFTKPRVTLSPIEAQMLDKRDGAGPVYTFDVLTKLKELTDSTDAKTHYVFVIGPDNANPETWTQFYRHTEIEKQFGLHIVKERIAIRSTQCRHLVRRCRKNMTGCTQRLRTKLTQNVIDFIQKKGLYA